MADERIELSGKVALVTGSARHLGRGVALGLARRGCDVAIHYRESADEARALADRIAAMGRRSVAVRADATRADHVARLVATVESELGGPDILVNGIGDYERGTVAETTPELWQTVLDSNLTAAFLCSREAAGRMAARGWGRIIQLGFVTAAAMRARPGLAAYAAAKAALVSFSRSLALEVAGRGVTVNVVNPGYFEHEDTTDRQRNAEAQKVPMGRLGTVNDLASVVCFLCTDGAAYLTGNALDLSGGFGL